MLLSLNIINKLLYMKNVFYLGLLFVFLFSNYTYAQLNVNADPGSTGMTWNTSDIGKGSEALLTINLGNYGSSGSIPSNTVNWIINLPYTMSFVRFENLTGSPFYVYENFVDEEDGTTIIRLRNNVAINACSFTNFTCNWNIQLTAKGEQTGGPFEASLNIVRINPMQVGNASAMNDNQVSPITVSTVLPIILTTFNADINNCIVGLNWSTASEIDFSHFELERSSDNFSFLKIAEVKGGKYQYKYNDTLKEQGEYFYRLKMVDINNAVFNYSGVKRAKLNCEGKLIKVYPTVTSGLLNVYGVKGAQIMLYNSIGQLIDHKKMNNDITQFDLGNKPAGIYNLVVIDIKGERNNYKVVKK